MRAKTAATVTTLIAALVGAWWVPVAAVLPSAFSASGIHDGSARADLTAGPSRRLVIPRLGVDAGSIPVGVTAAGQLAVGTSVRSVYRWRYGVVAGQPGSAVLAGHTWSRGAGVFDRLGELRLGDPLRVGTTRFRVTRVRRVTSMSAAEVRALFSDRGRPRLVLITCGNRNNTTGIYRTRILVNAKKV